jgi:hypothetical protein
MRGIDETVKKTRLIVTETRKRVEHLRRASVLPLVEESIRLINESQRYIERARQVKQNPWWLPRKPE